MLLDRAAVWYSCSESGSRVLGQEWVLHPVFWELKTLKGHPSPNPERASGGTICLQHRQLLSWHMDGTDCKVQIDSGLKPENVFCH